MPGVNGGACPETRFGTWFISSRVWREHVVRTTVADLLRLLGRPAPASPVVLDVGCGVGGALPMLDAALAPAALLGRDVDGALLRRAAREAAPQCRCRLNLALAGADRLDLDGETVDVVLCHQTLHHTGDPEAVARELHRVLKPGGVLLAAESCVSFTCSRRVRLLFRHATHVQRPAAEWVDLVRASGFVVDPARVHTPYPWWARADFGVLERLGRRVPADHDQPIVHFVGIKPPSRSK